MMPEKKNEEMQNFENNPKNKEINADEIKEIERINNYLNPNKEEKSEGKEGTEQLDKAKIKINQIDNAFLENIKRQGELILKGIQFKEGEKLSQQQLTAMLSFLKIHQMQNPGSIEGDISLSKNNGAELDIDDVLNIVGTEPNNFGDIIPRETINYLNDLLVSRKNKLESDKQNFYKKAKDGEIYKNSVQGNVEGGSQDSVDSNPEVSAEKAKIYIQNLIDKIGLNKDSITSKDIVNKNFNIIRNAAQQNEKLFGAAVNGLIDNALKILNVSLTTEESKKIKNLNLNNKTMYSDKVRLFQEKALEKYGEIIGAGMNVDKVIDGKLGYNTLYALLQINQFDEDRFQEKKDIKNVIKNKEKRTVDGKEAENYPDNVKRILSMGEFGADGKFKFYDGENGKEDYVQEDDKGKFVNIGGERYYIEGECKCGDEFNKFKQVVKPYIGYDENGNEITLYKRILSFGKVHENGRFEGTKVTIDGNQKQVKSETFDAPKVREIGNKKVPSNIVDVKLGNNIDDNGDFKGKWRIDLFTDKDKKTLNEKELNSLDKKDLLTFLNMAINDYKETDHKPSGIGQANLNLVIDLAIRELRKEDNRAVLGELIKNADPRTGYFANGISPEERVSRFLNLDPGLYSNPDNIINKNNLEGEELKKYNSLETNAEKRKYRSTLKQGDRIINRLKLLQKALEGKTDTEPSTTKSETEVNKQEEIIDSAIGNLASSGDDVRDKIGGGKLKGNIPGERQDQNEGVVSTEDDDTPSQEKEKTINNQDIGTFGKLEANIQYNLNKYKIGSINQGAFIYLGKFSGFDNNMIHILNEYNGRVGLDGGKINPEMISQLTNGPKQISISGNIDNSDEALLNSLKNIGKIDRGIFLPHLNNVNGNMCEYLTTWGRVSLEGLKTIDSDSLRVLGTSKINHLALGHVDITNQEDVRNLLKNYDGRLSLNSIPEIDVDAAKGLENQKNTVKINSVGKLDLTDENILKSLGKMKTKLVINNVENIIVDENKKQEYMEKYNITISGKKIIVNNNLNHF